MAANNVKIIADDSQFQTALNNAGMKLVVVDFHATWYDFYATFVVLI